MVIQIVVTFILASDSSYLKKAHSDLF